MTMRIAVTGAGGFVMANVIPELVHAGWTVIAIDRAFGSHLRQYWGELPPERLILHEADAHDLPDTEAEALILGAALTASPEELDISPEAHYRANLLPTLNALDWAQANHVRRVIGVSSGAVYAETDGPVTEAQPVTPRGLYAAAKSAIEALFTALHDEHGRDLAVIRLSNIYGINELSRSTRPRVSLIGRLIDEALAHREIGLPNEPARDWTFAPDVGRALVALLGAPSLPHAVYNVASGQRVTPSEIAAQIRTILPQTTVISATEPPVSLARRGWLSSERLAQDTGFRQWTPFEDGLRQAVKARLMAASLTAEVAS